MSMKEWLTRTAGKLQRNLPSILTGSGIFHMLLGTGLAVKATPEAMRKIEEKKEEEGHERLTFSQTMQAVWRCYIWAALAEGVGIGCVIGGQVESNKRQAALTMLVNSAEIGAREFREYRRYVRERLGEQKEAEIHNQAVQTVVDQTPPPADMAGQPRGNVHDFRFRRRLPRKDLMGKDIGKRGGEPCVRIGIRLLPRRGRDMHR